MRRITFVFVMLSLCMKVSAQWLGTPPGPIYYTGRTWIGTNYTSSLADLHVGAQMASAGSSGEIIRLSLQPYGHTGGPWYLKARDNAYNAWLDFGYGSTSPNLSLNANGTVAIGTPFTTSTANLHIGNQVGPAGSAGEALRLTLQPYGHTGGPWYFKSKDDAQSAFLEIGYGLTVSQQVFTLSANGSMGVGTNPAFQLHIRGKNPNSELMNLGAKTTGSFALTSADGGAYGLFAGVGSSGKAWLQAGRYDTNTAYDIVLQASGGNVLIGRTTANPNYKLDVNGSIRSNEVVVNTTGADFVFETDYKLSDLESVAKFIKEHKHLPEIESADEMKSNGLNVGKLEIKLLQKIEELTLYIIEINSEVKKLRQDNTVLEKQIAEIKNEIQRQLDIQQKAIKNLKSK